MTRPRILALTDDLFLIPSLEDAADRLGYRLQVVSRPEDLGAEGASSLRAIALTEPLEGPEAELVRGIVLDRPALVLVDVSCRSVPWERWIQILKTSAATRRIPILAFGPHVEGGVLGRARTAGADIVLSRGALLSRLAEHLRSWARVRDPMALERACQGELSEKARKGIDEFNAGRYFEAHELLEHAWMEATDEAGDLYRSVLQVGVACLHIQRGNPRGAAKMLLRVPQWLDPLPDHCRGVDVGSLRATVSTLRTALESAKLSQSPLLASKLLESVALRMLPETTAEDGSSPAQN